jgi:hypothetical protein
MLDNMEFPFICLIMNLIGWHWQVPETGHKKQDQATQPIGSSQENDESGGQHREKQDL